jgi:hypothetical protein
MYPEFCWWNVFEIHIIIIFIIIIIIIIIALQLFVGPWLLFHFFDPIHIR